MLTDFGSRWREWDIGRRKKEREEGERNGQKNIGGREKIVGEQQPQSQSEEERPVPGMNGLTVEFVREVLSIYNKGCFRSGDGDGYNNSTIEHASGAEDNEDEIYSDRLPRGRYVLCFFVS